MHQTGLVKLSHTGIHHRVTGHSVAPFKELLFIIAPAYQVIFFLEACVNHMWKIRDNHHEKLSPD
ncbi:hypothetical protein SDC9_169808 [bioreactor metagenome]|uniref:Uncharacterized protein n=1 Tax=bioreactor metagenome TaxID=1076179 RepID=A0A645G701_9ZZZZ